MKICVAQTKSIKGDIQRNMGNHKKLIDLAVSNGANIIIFPELSLTGYEPSLAKALVTHQDDSRFDDFQKISDTNQITIGVGMPTNSDKGVCISMVLFQPHKARQTYSKKYIHPDEEPFFVSGENFRGLKIDETPIGLAICYEALVPEHAQKAFENGAKIYIASVAKSAKGVEKAFKSLADIAQKYGMTVLMSNCFGECDDFESVGQSAVWNNKGILLGQLSASNEGIIIMDTETQKVEYK